MAARASPVLTRDSSTAARVERSARPRRPGSVRAASRRAVRDEPRVEAVTSTGRVDHIGGRLRPHDLCFPDITSPPRFAERRTIDPRSASASSATSMSSTPVIARASAEFGKNQSVPPSSSSRRPNVQPDPNSGRRRSSRRLREPRGTGPEGRAAARSAGSTETYVHVSRGSQEQRIHHPPRRSPIVPSAVRIARSSPRARITERPSERGQFRIDRQPRVSIPLSARASNMNRPNTSSPTTPANAVLRPSRAAPRRDRARASDRQASLGDEPLGLPERRLDAPAGEHEVPGCSPQHEQVESATGRSHHPLRQGRGFAQRRRSLGGGEIAPTSTATSLNTDAPAEVRFTCRVCRACRTG